MSEVLVRHFRDPKTFQFRRLPLAKFRVKYDTREREAVLTVLQGILHNNPYLEEFEIEAVKSETFLNVNLFVENFEDFRVGKKLRKLKLLDSFKYTESTQFLEGGTEGIEHLSISKTILTQRNFRLS